MILFHWLAKPPRLKAILINECGLLSRQDSLTICWQATTTTSRKAQPPGSLNKWSRVKINCLDRLSLFRLRQFLDDSTTVLRMRKYSDIGQYGPHAQRQESFRMATNAAGYGSNHSFSAATLYRLHQVGASAFDQIAERTVRGKEPLRVTTGRGIPLQLSTKGARMNARLKARPTHLPLYPTELPARTYTTSWSEPSGIKQLVDMGTSATIHEPPASPALAPLEHTSHIYFECAQEVGFPCEEAVECITLVAEDAPLPEELDAAEWDMWLKDTDGGVTTWS